MPRTLTIGLFLAMLACGVIAQENNQPEAIRVETRLVSVPVIVSDRYGRYIPNLTQADFSVFQDGVEQQIAFFAPSEEPLNVALLIDTSQSTRFVLDDIKDSARDFLKLLLPQDRAMIVTFDYDVHFLSSLTSDQDELKKAIRRADLPERGFVGTTMRDAVYETMSGAFHNLSGRKAIILLTDGKDVDSRIAVDELLHRVEESDTLIYTVMFRTQEHVRRPSLERARRVALLAGVPPPKDRRNDPREARLRMRLEQMNRDAESFLQDLSDTTGGRFASSRDGRLKRTFISIVDELRFQYRLGFYPPDEPQQPETHQLKVKLSRPDSVVRSRTSYRAPAQ